MKSIIAEREKEKGRLITDNYSREEMANHAKGKSGILSDQLISTEHSLKNLKDKQTECVINLRTLVEQTEELVQRESAGEKDRQDLEDLLNKLIAERSDLIFRMNNLTDKYDQYVNEMTKERKDIDAENNKRTRMMASSILFSTLLKQRDRRLRASLEGMKHVTDYLNEVQRRIIELGKWQNKYKEKLVNLAFQRWKHSELKWTNERRIIEILLEKERVKKQRAMILSL